MEASSDLVGRPLTRAATPERQGEHLSLFKQYEEAGELCLNAGLWWASAMRRAVLFFCVQGILRLRVF